MLQRLTSTLHEEPAGRTSPSIEPIDGRSHLVLRNKAGRVLDRRSIASVQCTESDGSTYSIFLGDTQP